jgi:hypothetical protein
MSSGNIFKKLGESSRFVSVLLTVFLLLLVMVSGPKEILADVAVGAIGFGYGYGHPGDQPPRICVDHRDITLGWDADPVGINALDYRTGLYAFAGEMIEYTILVRDPNGAIDIGLPRIGVGGSPEVLCNEIPLNQISNNNCNSFGEVNPETDKAYHCLLTAEQNWYGEEEVTIETYNSAFQPTQALHVETWFFNPQVSFSMTTSDGNPIHFKEMPYGADTPEERTVHSENRLVLENTAEGGVNMWMYIAGTDFYPSEGPAKCPTTNKLDIGNMAYRAWSGTQWTSWEGWVQMEKYNQDAPCTMVAPGSFIDEPLDGPDYNLHPEADTDMKCYGGIPAPYDYNVAEDWQSHILTNSGKMEIEFKLTYPMPCIGEFDQGSILVFSKVI